MKKIFFVGLIVLFNTLIHTATVRAAVTITNPNLKYFGYYFTDFNPGHHTVYFSEIHNLSNSNVVRSNFTVDHLRTLKNNNLRAIMSPPGGYSSFEIFLTKWDTWKQNLPADLRDTIYSFYYDEPFWKNRDDPAFPALFKKITQKIHIDFPDKAIMVVEAYPMFGDTNKTNFVASGIQYVTDIGVDFYFAHDGSSWSQYMEYYNKLKLISGNRKIWLIPDGYAGSQNHPGNPTTISNVKLAFDNYLNLANTDLDVVGMLNFVYGTHPNFPVNLRQILQSDNDDYDPTFRARQVAVGKAILANNPAPTPTSTPIPGDLNEDNQVNSFDYNLFISKFGNPYTIFDYNNLVANYGK